MKYTIFTPTYNRKETLITLYNSLKRQKYRNFEWLIIDDGSSDNTKEVVDSFIIEGQMDINYIYQGNGGKHRAFNVGIEKCKGEFMICVDSDDYLTDDALEKMNSTVYSSNDIMAFCFLCIGSNGEIQGDQYPIDNSKFNLITLTYEYKVRGDKLWIFNTKILKKYRFPEIDGEKFLTEGVLLFSMALEHDIYVSNQKLLIIDYKAGGLTAIGNNKLFLENPKGAVLYYKLLLKIAPNFKYRIYYLLNYMKFYKKKISKG